MSHVVVAVVDDAVINIRRIILVAVGIVEGCQALQVGRGMRGWRHEVATKLIDKHILVDGLLNTFQDTVDIEHRIHLLVEFRIIDVTIGSIIEHITA